MYASNDASNDASNVSFDPVWRVSLLATNDNFINIHLPPKRRKEDRANEIY